MVVEIVLAACLTREGNIVSKDKLVQNAPAILAGFILGSWFNGLHWATENPTCRPLEVAATAG